ncbi:MAG: 4-phosphoerythronate dehydrogenase [Alcanivorax sp.]|uniref:4-phosphoerythronate dehydrogenase n=1 Tax=Alloalcanivorax marinus TaxID=1177169 RepID=UPI001957D3A8|nr:4-phosphoerythronate dehydrogenase [Alloalcanivorax marinus]MBM7334317.1 4-phosphoerythronate dehydrogenase [Alloalcanivorax marinus]
MHIVADENMPALECFERRGTVTRVNGRTLTRDALADAEVLLVRSVTRVDRALLEGTPVRFVGSATIGTDHVDRAALDALGIAFAHAPGCNARAVAEYVLQALLLACQRQGRALHESRVGVVGLGNVGGRVAAWLNALGATVIGCDPPLARSGARAPVPLTGLDAVLDADLITLHVPLTLDGEDATRHLLDAERLALLGPEQTLISTCRGAVIDNRALARRLAAGQGPLTLLDVWENEPRPDPALLERVWLGSPHVAGYSVEGKWRGTAMLHDAWCRWAGEAAPGATPPVSGKTLDAPVHDEADLLALLRRAYRLHEDDRRLREALAGDDPGVAFDALRKHYPPRHELLYWRHQGEVAAPFKPLVGRLFASE